ncbi:beta-galactosidase [Arthrobacter livingstonensis]|uniref:Beta-galactosidase n=1 Tax=Arthrobacter livingstonensis TaxID=670078 RepID=A0A2V5L480_9MICC|nr:beta-galactosidase [Arthrobacter livingstonensis]PYI66129.1 beta-galactosidase [Arthrobacter livingstonensis]
MPYPSSDTPAANPSPADSRAARLWEALPGLSYGADYNPEQWPEDIRRQDVELMKEAGVTVLSVGIFSWAWLEPSEGRYDFAWLDGVLDSLADAGIKVALATATAAPPAWLVLKHPEILPVAADGTTLGPGSRRHYSPSSSVYRRYAARMTRALADRYGDHPALALWHVDNELGCHISEYYGPEDAEAFRGWLRRRYGSIEALNDAWGTAFWSQRYGGFAEVQPPAPAPTTLNPTQQLDFQRFSSWALIDFYNMLAAVIHEVTPDVPTTTNLMASSATKSMDYFSWAKDLDVIANDHYLVAADTERHIELAFSADLTRGIADGKPWMLMEHSTSAVNWQPRNLPKLPGEMARNSLAHVARGSDAVMFFQWRQSRQGSEKFHSAMVPHDGTATRVWREVVELGAALKALAQVQGSRVESRTAIIFDYEAWWASELDSHPSQDVKYLTLLRAFHRELFLRGITADLVQPGADLSGYSLILVCTLYTVTDAAAANIAAAAERGATVLVSYFSGIVDQHDAVRLGGYPGAFRELLGINSEEFHPLPQHGTVGLDNGWKGRIWSENVRLAGAEAVVSFTGHPLAGVPALTRRVVGSGAAWYLATFPDDTSLAGLLDSLLAESGVAAPATAPAGVELTRRLGAGGASFLFVINHTGAEADVAASGRELVTGTQFSGVVQPGAVAVIVEDAPGGQPG